MGGVVEAIVAVVKFIAVGSSGWAVAARLAVSATVAAVAARRAGNFDPGIQQRALTTRGTTEPQKLVYGEALVSGPLGYLNVGGKWNRDMHAVVLLAGHEVDSITDIYLDGDVISNSIINGGAAAGGEVSSGKYGPIVDSSTTLNVVRVNKYLGTATQTADADLVAAVDRNSVTLGWTSTHRLRGIAYIACKFSLYEKTETLWQAGEPTNIRALVRGKKIYDPRLDSTNGGSGTHRYTDSTTWEWSNNPALCLADYLMDTKFGLSMDPTRIDWSSVDTAADYCDGNAAIPTASTETRFTCNGVIFSSASHKDNIENILSSFNGKLTKSGGVWYIRAGQYIAPTETIADSELAGSLGIRSSLDRGERFNTIRAVYPDKDMGYKPNNTPDIYTTALRNRDNGRIITREVSLPFTDSWYMAQRLCWQMLHVANQEMQVVAPMNLSAMRVKAGDRVNFNVDELSWAPKIFDVVSWKVTEGGGDDLGIELLLREDSSSAWDDPLEGDYTTRSAAGVLTFGSPGTPVATSLTATNQTEGVLVEWTNPGDDAVDDGGNWKEVTVWASATSAWSGAVAVYRGRANNFLHVLAAGTTRYYWVTYKNDENEPEDVTDARYPDSDTSSVSGTAQAVAAADVTGLGGLATEDTVDYTSDVTGSKPPSNADNTAANNNWSDVTDDDGNRPENQATFSKFALFANTIWDTGGEGPSTTADTIPWAAGNYPTGVTKTLDYTLQDLDTFGHYETIRLDDAAVYLITVALDLQESADGATAVTLTGYIDRGSGRGEIEGGQYTHFFNGNNGEWSSMNYSFMLITANNDDKLSIDWQITGDSVAWSDVRDITMSIYRLSPV